jgi:hypothetical protein
MQLMPLTFTPQGVILRTADRRVSGKNQYALHRTRDGDYRLTAATLALVYKATATNRDYYEAP